MKNPPMLPADRHAVRLLIDQADAEISAERRCFLLTELNAEYGRRLGAEGRRNESLRRCLIGAAAYGAAVTLALVFVWMARS